MSRTDEIINSLVGALYLARQDDRGLARFNLTSDGFWFSFAAILLLLPFYLLAGEIDKQTIDQPGTPDSILLAFTLAAQWIAWPIAMIFVARILNLSGYYGRYITVYNWASVIIMAFTTLPLLAMGIGLLGKESAYWLSFMAFLVTLYYRWYITRLTLETGAAIAAALVLGDIVLSLSIIKLLT